MQIKDVTQVSSQGADANRRTDRANSEERADAKSPARESGASADTVTISGSATSLQSLLGSAGEPPAIDTQRVDAIKAALSEGRYEIDAERIAAKLIQLESEL